MLPYTPIPEEDIRHFDEKGYLIVRNVLDEDTIAHLIDVSDRLIASDHQVGRQRKPDGLYDSFRNTVTLDDAYIPLITQEKILPLVVHLLGSNLQLMTSHHIYKHPDPPGTPETRRTPGWHRGSKLSAR